MHPQRVQRDMTSPMGHGNLICNQSLWDQTNIFAWALSDIRPIRLWLHNSPKMSTLLHFRMQNDEQIGGVCERERWNWDWEQPAWKLKCVLVLILVIMFFSYISWVILNDVFIFFGSDCGEVNEVLMLEFCLEGPQYIYTIQQVVLKFCPIFTYL